jgi:ribosomal 50S subunit-associated protein YjgA (DUF615 family)
MAGTDPQPTEKSTEERLLALEQWRELKEKEDAALTESLAQFFEGLRQLLLSPGESK